MLRTNWQNETKFCIHIIIDKIYVGIVNRCFSQTCNGVTTLDWFKNLVFAPYLKNESTGFNQILYKHYHWQELQICNRVTTWLTSELVQLWTAELAALDQLKKIFYLLENYFKILAGSQVSDRCPLGYLFSWDVRGNYSTKSKVTEYVKRLYLGCVFELLGAFEISQICWGVRWGDRRYPYKLS